MFSHRTSWNLTPNALAALMERKSSAGVRVIDLTLSNPTAAGILYPGELIKAGFDNLSMLTYAPSARGLESARKSIVRQYGSRGALMIPEDVHLTASTSEGYAWLMKLLADPGDSFAVPSPSYPLLDFLADLEHVRLDKYRLRYSDSDGWRVDFASLEAVLTPQTRAVIVVNPNNPTGSYLSREEMNHLLALCSSSGIALISDEVFHDYHHDTESDRPSMLEAEADCPVFILDGISKSLALPQMKIGWIVSRGPEELVREARNRLDIIADTFLSVNTPAQLALAGWWCAREDIQARICGRCRENLVFLARALADCPRMRALPVEGGWYAILEMTDETDDEEIAYRLLESDDVFVYPGSYFDYRSGSALVVSLLPPSEDFADGIGRVAARFS